VNHPLWCPGGRRKKQRKAGGRGKSVALCNVELLSHGREGLSRRTMPDYAFAAEKGPSGDQRKTGFDRRLRATPAYVSVCSPLLGNIRVRGNLLDTRRNSASPCWEHRPVVAERSGKTTEVRKPEGLAVMESRGNLTGLLPGQ